VGSIAQTVPFHRSATVPKVDSPTAMQEEGDTQEMPSSCAPRAPRGLGVRCRRQLWPFQRWTIGSGVPEKFETRETPNAVHAFEIGQATPISWSPCVPSGFDVRWMLHLVPFQRSASVKRCPEASKYQPTAVQAADALQSALFRTENCAPGGFGVWTIRHLDPFQRSASVPALDPPTALHDEDEVQATPSRKPPPCAGFGVGWMRHFVPFQCSASVPRLDAPTAVQAKEPVHDTSSR
jgi:hypothetical protein